MTVTRYFCNALLPSLIIHLQHLYKGVKQCYYLHSQLMFNMSLLSSLAVDKVFLFPLNETSLSP